MKEKPKSKLEICSDTLDILVTTNLTKDQIMTIAYNIHAIFRFGDGLLYSQFEEMLDQKLN